MWMLELGIMLLALDLSWYPYGLMDPATAVYARFAFVVILALFSAGRYCQHNYTFLLAVNKLTAIRSYKI